MMIYQDLGLKGRRYADLDATLRKLQDLYGFKRDTCPGRESDLRLVRTPFSGCEARIYIDRAQDGQLQVGVLLSSDSHQTDLERLSAALKLKSEMVALAIHIKSQVKGIRFDRTEERNG